MDEKRRNFICGVEACKNEEPVVVCLAGDETQFREQVHSQTGVREREKCSNVANFFIAVALWCFLFRDGGFESEIRIWGSSTLLNKLRWI